MKVRYPWNVGKLVQAVPMYRLNPRYQKRATAISEGRYTPGAFVALDDAEYRLIGGYVTTSNPYALWDFRGVDRDGLVEHLTAIGDRDLDDDAERLREYDRAAAKLHAFDVATDKQAEYDLSGYEFEFAAYKPHIADLLAGEMETHSYPIHHPNKRVRDIELNFWRHDYKGDGSIDGYNANWAWRGEATFTFVEDPKRPNMIHGLAEFDAGVLMSARRFAEKYDD